MDNFVGEIRMVAFNFAPRGWAFCNGQTISISQNQALFALLGTTYGGNGTTTFQLPDLQCRVPVHAGNGAGLSPVVLGEKAGTESITLTNQQLPQHTHVATFTPTGGGGTPSVSVTLQGSSASGTTDAPAGNYLAGAYQSAGRGAGALFVANPASSTLGNLAGVTATLSGVSGGGGTVTNALTGSGLPFDIQQPYLGVYFIIALQGVYPTRN